MITWMKAKYSSHKPRGKYGSGHNDGNKKQKKLGGLGRHAEPTHQRVLVVDGASGKRRWIWRPVS